MEKSPDAFRTISEVAEWLDIPTHVLRFWESRFAQIKPVKRAGGRRYYRPSDMRLIGGVKALLHDQGMTIRGVQKLLREHGVKHVSSFSQSLDTDLQDTSDDTVVEHAATPTSPALSVRQTYKAEPETEPDSEPADDEEDGEQLDIFSGAQKQDADEEILMPTFVPSRSRPAPDAAPTQPTAIEPPAPTPPQIPATPNVPETDPGDDDPAFSDAPGIAARLAVLPTAHLAAHHCTLKAARDRLIALRNAQS
jgi:DNA-binding transcriptional MerR regulator